MTSKHYRWQTRWRVAGGLATHETGLQVQLVHGQPHAANAQAVQAALAPKHGHNAAAMVQRLLREARTLLEQPHA